MENQRLLARVMAGVPSDHHSFWLYGTVKKNSKTQQHNVELEPRIVSFFLAPGLAELYLRPTAVDLSLLAQMTAAGHSPCCELHRMAKVSLPFRVV